MSNEFIKYRAAVATVLINEFFDIEHIRRIIKNLDALKDTPIRTVDDNLKDIIHCELGHYKLEPFTGSYPEKMDELCKILYRVINTIPGMQYISSNGYNNTVEDVKVSFYCKDQSALFFLKHCVDSRYWEYGHYWQIEVMIEDKHPIPSVCIPIYYELKIITADYSIVHDSLNELIKSIEKHLNDYSFINNNQLHDLVDNVSKINEVDIEHVKMIMNAIEELFRKL